MKRIEETLQLLQQARQRSDSVLVSYSGGKDAMVTLDLCVRVFRKVEGFFMYLVPGLEVIETALAEAEVRYGIKIRQYPHFGLRDALIYGLYCPNSYKHDDLPSWKLKDIYRLARADSGIDVIATGMKRSDSLERRLNIGKTLKDLYPLAGWSKADVLAYLKIRGLALPDSAGGRSNAVDLSTKNLLWLHDSHPADFAKIETVFPYVRAAVYRREWYGIVS
jgi:phosphoadenosine phosphosulfate reductase